jgi:dolichol-phosphate mannosyltransferase
MENIKLTVFIPVYKEAENLKILLPGLIKSLNESEPQYEILVVDTVQPMDQTKEICISAGNKVVYANREKGNEFGNAVRTAIKLAKGEYFIQMDGDGSHDPEFIKQLYKAKDLADVVVASRYVDGGATQNLKILILMSWIVNFIYSKVLNLDCKDVSNSFKLYRAQALKNLSLYCENFDIIEEILFKLKRANNNLAIKELPFTFKTRMFGETKRNLFLFILTYIFTLIKLKFGD